MVAMALCKLKPMVTHQKTGNVTTKRRKPLIPRPPSRLRRETQKNRIKASNDIEKIEAYCIKPATIVSGSPTSGIQLNRRDQRP